FDEIKEMSETFIANDTSSLVPQRQKALDYDNPDPALELQNVSPLADTTVPSQQELDLLFSPLSTSLLLPPTILFKKTHYLQRIFNLHQNRQLQQIFMLRKTTIIKQNLPILSVHKYKKMLSLPHAILPVQTRQQLATNPEMCMFALTVSIVEPKNIKEAMADSKWIEAMQEELH
ncbi:hypothetical protein Tco_0171274, partial [Tanacetum coccineum]